MEYLVLPAILILAILAVVGATYLLLIVLVFIGSIIDGFNNDPDFGFDVTYECISEYRKWVNFLRYLKYIFAIVVFNVTISIGYKIGSFIRNTSFEIKFLKKIKQFLFYSKQDTCKEKE